MPCSESKRLFNVWASTLEMRDTYFLPNSDQCNKAIRKELTYEARRALQESTQHLDACSHCRAEAMAERVHAKAAQSGIYAANYRIPTTPTMYLYN